ncbi:MAG: hypothetical protein J6I53_10645 [Treponema sp.]|nr:hypothetical protein [Treponema sp.]
MKKVVCFAAAVLLAGPFALVSCKSGDDGDTVYVPYVPETSDENQNSLVETVAETPVITEQPQDATYALGQKTVNDLRVIASVSDGGSLSYQWFKDDKVIPGATSKRYTPDVSASGVFEYNCEVTNTLDSSVRKSTSSYAKITVQAGSDTVYAATPVITKNPVSASYKSGDTVAALSVVASVTDDGLAKAGTLSYQWYLNDEAVYGATSAEYTPWDGKAPDVKENTSYKFYCTITNTYNDATEESGKTKERTSGNASITVLPADYNKTYAATPVITKNPVGASYTSCDTVAALSVEADVTETEFAKKGTLSYQWYLNDEAVSGATSAEYTPWDGKVLKVEKTSVYEYYCKVVNTYSEATDTSKTTSSVNSETVTITVNPLPSAVTPTITSDLNATATGTTSTGVSLSVTATVSDGGSLSYQWYKDGSAISGATGSTYKASASGTYYVAVTNSLNDTTASTKSTSCVVTITSDDTPGSGAITINFN